MRVRLEILWVLMVGLLAPDYGTADPYAILRLGRNSVGEFYEISRLDTYYTAVDAVGSNSGLPIPPRRNDPDNRWVYWDASSVGFKMGVPTEDFPSQFTATASIENAIDAWDDVESSALSITYDGLDVNLANDPGDGTNVIFWSNHTTISDVNGFTLITALTGGDDIGEFVDVDIVLNDGRRWTTGNPECGADGLRDVQSVVTHELGHALGLGHATEENTMTPGQAWCEDSDLDSLYEAGGQRTIYSGDRSGYRYIYVGDNSVRSLLGDGETSEKVVAVGGDDSVESGVVKATVFPNPFNPEVTVAFELDHSATVSVRVYDELGQRVRVLAAEAQRPAGFYQFVWDGLDQAGRSQASGTYFLVVSVDGTTESHKLTLLH